MSAYDSVNFQPPAPVASVVVRCPTSGASVQNFRMLLDTGADVSLLPRNPLAAVLPDMSNLPTYDLMGFEGTKSSSPAVQMVLELLGKKFRGQFLLVDCEYGILGRNILNSLALLLDGPSGAWNEKK